MLLWHQSITLNRLVNAKLRSMASADKPGFCKSCGEEHSVPEPSAQGLRCSACGADEVYGTNALILEL